MSDRRGALAWEARWSLRTAIVTFVAIAFLLASFVVVTSLGGGGEAESLREINENGGTVTLASIFQAVGFVLLVVPLVYVFQAALFRSDRMRSQFRALVVAAPLALAVGGILNGVAANEAASDFVAGKAHATLTFKEASSECRSERKEDVAEFRNEFGKGDSAVSDCVKEKREDDAASNAIKDASLRRVAEGFQFGGALALAFALVYCSLNALRTGLLSRFWGSLGIALGVAVFLGLFQIALIWFAYVGLVAGGWLPGGRPPAWAAGEAIPWPSPGEKMATELSPPENPDASDGPSDNGQSR